MTPTDTRDPDQIQRDIHQQQEEMSRTVDRLGEQLTLRNVVDALFEKTGNGQIDTSALLDGARRNPIALGMISVGAIWLLSDHDADVPSFRSSGSDDAYSPYEDADYDPDHRLYLSHMSSVERRADEDEPSYMLRRDEARGTFLMLERAHDEDHKSYRERLDQATEAMRNRRDQFTQGARQRGEQLARTGRSAARATTGAYYDNPLLGGLAAALVGAIAGSALPTTQTEREQLGAQGARTLDMARDKAHELGDEALQKKDELVDKADRKMAGQSTKPSPATANA